MRPLRCRAAVKHHVKRETRGHCWTVHYSNRWDGCRRSQIDPSAYGKLFVEVQSLAMTSFPIPSSASSKAIDSNKSIVMPDPKSIDPKSIYRALFCSLEKGGARSRGSSSWMGDHFAASGEQSRTQRPVDQCHRETMRTGHGCGKAGKTKSLRMQRRLASPHQFLSIIDGAGAWLCSCNASTTPSNADTL